MRWFLLCLLASFHIALADPLPAPVMANSFNYVAQVPVATQSSAEVPQALNLALKQVLIKISGDPNIINNPRLQHLIANPSSVMRQFNYQAVPFNISSSGLILQVTFDKVMLDHILRKIQNSNGNTTVTGDTATSLSPPPLPDVLAAPMGAVPMQVVISPVNNYNDYQQAIALVQRIPGVLRVSIQQATGNFLILNVHFNGSRQNFQSAINQQTRLKIWSITPRQLFLKLD